jgi:hypothetical protein
MSKTAKEVLVGKKGRKQKGSGTKKHGRNKVKCAKYRAEGRREKNKARKQRKLLRAAESRRRKNGREGKG